MSPTAPLNSGTSTINRTLLHSQQQFGPSAGSSHISTRNGGNTAGLRGLALSIPGDSPPPEYNVVVHENRHGFFLLLFFTKHNFFGEKQFFGIFLILRHILEIFFNQQYNQFF